MRPVYYAAMIMKKEYEYILQACYTYFTISHITDITQLLSIPDNINQEYEYILQAC